MLGEARNRVVDLLSLKLYQRLSLAWFMMSESSGSDIPEGETRQTSNHTFTKHLPAVAFSHYESRDEVRELDYTPTINRNDHFALSSFVSFSPPYPIVCSM
jgi:hypothetical protein